MGVALYRVALLDKRADQSRISSQSYLISYALSIQWSSRLDDSRPFLVSLFASKGEKEKCDPPSRDTSSLLIRLETLSINAT